MKNKYSVHISWMVPESCHFDVEAESEDEAIDKALEENDEIGEDYQVEGVRFISEVKEIPFEDPNQIKMDFLQ